MMDWRLTDHRGRPVTPDDWHGQPVMAFFGFTWCPDVCPTTLMDISDWLDGLGSEADPLVVALITVDPARDTPDVLADYVANFDSQIIGLTGSADEISRAASDFRVIFEKVPAMTVTIHEPYSGGVSLRAHRQLRQHH